MRDEPGTRRRRRAASVAPPPAPRSYALIAVVLVLVTLVGIVAIIAYRILLPSGNPVELPSFTGMQYDDAQSEASKAHVNLRIVARHPDERVPQGGVLGQFPAAGEHVREGRVVDVIVSDGSMPTSVPNLSNMSLRDAQVELGNARLELGKVTSESSTTVSAGHVLSQHPDPFTNVSAGTKIDVSLATGKAEVYVPNFVGLTLTFSQSAAKRTGVTLGPPLWLPIAKNARPKGTVIAQEPLPGQPLAGDKVILQVSGGAPATPTPLPTLPPSPTAPPTQTPPPVATPEVSTSPGSAATPTAAPSARSLRIAVQLPSSKAQRRVRVTLVDATGSRDLWDQMTTGGFTLSFDVTITGPGVVQTYSEGALTTSTPL